MGIFDTVVGQDLKRVGSGIKKAGQGILGSLKADNLFFGTGRDMDLIKGLGQYMMSPAPSQIEGIKEFSIPSQTTLNLSLIHISEPTRPY